MAMLQLEMYRCTSHYALFWRPVHPFFGIIMSNREQSTFDVTDLNNETARQNSKYNQFQITAWTE